MSQPHPAPNGPLSRIHIRGWHMLIVAALVVIGIAIAMQFDDKDAPGITSGTPSDLCDLLREGWTGSQLASNDVWKSWPESQSPYSREMTIARAADRGGCFDLL